MKTTTYLFVLFFLICGLQVQGQSLSAEKRELASFIQALSNYSRYIPQEKVYLHFDNTSYYQGDDIWFKCYVTSGQHQLSSLSKTLYVELLNPGGEIVNTRILEIENGECHGEFTLNQLPFYSGFYEVRAYTKYMLNFGEDIIFSRLLPVFDKPKAEGNYKEKEMLVYGKGSYPVKRAKPERGKVVNMRFFPEGGNLVEGILSRVAFEVSDEAGNPIDVSGAVVDRKGDVLTRFVTQHEGKGIFTYIPDSTIQEVVVDYSGRKYRFELPLYLPQGVVMEVDNLSSPDSIGIILRKNSSTVTGLLGVVLLNGGKLQDYLLVSIEDGGEECFKMDKTRLPSGVSQIVLFNNVGEILAERLIFANTQEELNIRTKISKEMYSPNELVDMEFTITDSENNPRIQTFSLSVRDGMDEVEGRHTILTDLLLMSEIKGYVRNPSWYFERQDDIRSAALDLLLMVQGWRRYSWQQMAGIDSFLPKYFPEQGIEVNGKVVSFVKQKPQPNVDISLLLRKKGEDNKDDITVTEFFTTDSLGGFSFTMNTSGKWDMILGVTEKGKAKDHQIFLNRLFRPEPQRYRYADMQVTVGEADNGILNNEKSFDHSYELSEPAIAAAPDPLDKVIGITEEIHDLPEVTIIAKRVRERQIFRNRSTSVAYYDVHSELDDIYDRGLFIGNDINQMLINMNKGFEINLHNTITQSVNAPLTIYATEPAEDNNDTNSTSGGEYLLYKGKEPLFVINHERQSNNDKDIQPHRLIRLQAIKSVYINEELPVRMQYAPVEMSLFNVVNTYSCVVFIETYPEGEEIPVDPAKGIRKTQLEGYSAVKEFYTPDYLVLPLQSDYRRTLYWNPMVIPDTNGIARVTFYNNSRSKSDFSINAETVTSGGLIGIYK
ncbi:hypothetical protein [Parabacteroides sp. PF5-9]|uniref:hypothetical protein n=1 Tax=Parabacteroides sp. PF5-9 TaxID=1742404 RepID=UPI002475520A|nr:hypothetical protein [Parabacteroides sp. PF5-9]MDH6357312.1 hypothetical protein [Parabacteroides sp. PF5-9]